MGSRGQVTPTFYALEKSAFVAIHVTSRKAPAVAPQELEDSER